MKANQQELLRPRAKIVRAVMSEKPRDSNGNHGPSSKICSRDIQPLNIRIRASFVPFPITQISFY